MFFKRVLIAFFLSFATLFLFIFIIRLANGKNGFLGFSDLLAFFEETDSTGSLKIDFYKPIQKLIDDVKSTINNFNNIYSKMITKFGWWSTILLPVTATLLIVEIISVPCIIIWDLTLMVITYISYFVSFINYIISFEGWVSPIPAS